jgi:DNA topoisomerase-1
LVTSKDFRTWTGTVAAAAALNELERGAPPSNANIVRAVECVAERLGNTPAVCRKCYIHPIIFDSYKNGSLAKILQQKPKHESSRSSHRLRPDETIVFRLLRPGKK